MQICLILLHIQVCYQQGEEKDRDTENDRNNGLRMKKRNDNDRKKI